MNFKTLTLDDQAVFRAGEKSKPPTTGDTVFTNMFIWRSYHRPIWAESHGCLCVIFQPEGGVPFGLPPIGGGDVLKAVDFLVKSLLSMTSTAVLRQVPEGMIDFLSTHNAPYTYAHDRDNDDYVYTTNQLITLSGRRMHQKKNHYNHFINHNQFECLPITADLIPDLLAVQEGWLATKEEQSIPTDQLHHEMKSVHELLQHMEDLQQLGLAIRINGKIEAFTVGEKMSPDTALVHVEKANYDIRGLFVALASHFCREFFANLTYVNREQDLGLAGLRRSKESLKPDHLRKKFTIKAI
ncbi:MAG: DUF2156 domain-containing protein [Candidatus Adiutrix sp.]